MMSKTMTAASIRRQLRGRSASLARLLWLLCVCFGPIPAFASALPDPGLVYCPLQKTWVKKGGEIVKTEPLNTVCASDRIKEEFSYHVFRKLGPIRTALSDHEAEKLFFDHARLGDRAFAGGRDGQSPERPSFGGRGRSEKFTANELNTSPERVLRADVPPTVLAFAGTSEDAVFNRGVVNSSTKQFRISIPRGPPALLSIG